MLKSATIGASLLAPPHSVEASQQHGDVNSTSARPPISKAVLDAFSAASFDLYSKLNTGRAGGNEFKAFATSFSILFRHFGEVGVMEHVSRRVSDSNIFRKPMDPAFIEQVISTAQKSRLTINRTLAVNALAQSQKEWPTVQAIYYDSGLQGLTEYSIFSLHRYADEVARGGGLRAGRLEGSSRLVRPVFFGEACAAVAVASLYLATWGFMEAAGIIAVTGGAGAVAVATAGVAVAVAGMFCA